jgi:hypothetical protein
LKYVYLAGLAHSGSTFFSRVINEHPNIFVAGELLNTHKSLESPTTDCKCLQIRDQDYCEFWTEICNRLHKNGYDPDLLGRLNLDNRLDWMLSCASRFSLSLSEEFVAKNKFLLELIQEISGQNIIFDTSKRPWRLLALLELENQENIEIKVIHLSKNIRNQLGSRMRRGYNFWHSLVFKYLRKQLIYRITFGGKDYFAVQFEDFVENPEEILQHLYSWLDVEFINPFDDDTTETFHHLSGGGGDSIYQDLRPEPSQLQKDHNFSKTQEFFLDLFEL